MCSDLAIKTCLLFAEYGVIDVKTYKEGKRVFLILILKTGEEIKVGLL